MRCGSYDSALIVMVCHSPCPTGPVKSLLNKLPLLSTATATRFASLGKRRVTVAGRDVSFDMTNSLITSMVGWSYSDQSCMFIEPSFVPPCALTVDGDTINPSSKV